MREKGEGWEGGADEVFSLKKVRHSSPECQPRDWKAHKVVVALLSHDVC